MPPTVEHCLSNHAELEALDGDCTVEVRERRCLEHCGICRRDAFAVIDGDLVVGTDLSNAVRTLIDRTGGRSE